MDLRRGTGAAAAEVRKPPDGLRPWLSDGGDLAVGLRGHGSSFRILAADRRVVKTGSHRRRRRSICGELPIELRATSMRRRDGDAAEKPHRSQPARGGHEVPAARSYG